MRLQIELDQGSYTRLIKMAAAQRRPVDWQAEVVLKEALRGETTGETCQVEPQEDSAAKGAVRVSAPA
jgi:hypothetical protein